MTTKIEETPAARLERLVGAVAHRDVSQGSAEWHVMREYSIGGSRMASYSGLDQKRPAVKTIEAKLLEMHNIAEPETKSCEIAKRWGVVFESILRDFVAERLKTKIIGDKTIIPHPFIKSVHYSPDGMSAAEARRIEIIAGQRGAAALAAAALQNAVLNVVHEFKCPYLRQLREMVPDYYVPQLCLGLDTMPFVDCSLYSEAMFVVTTRGGALSGTIGPSARRQGCEMTAPCCQGVILFGRRPPGHQAGGALDIGAENDAENLFMEATAAPEEIRYSPILKPGHAAWAWINSFVEEQKPRAVLYWEMRGVQHFVTTRLEYQAAAPGEGPAATADFAALLHRPPAPEECRGYAYQLLPNLAPILTTFLQCSAAQDDAERIEILQKLYCTLKAPQEAAEKAREIPASRRRGESASQQLKESKPRAAKTYVSCRGTSRAKKAS